MLKKNLAWKLVMLILIVFSSIYLLGYKGLFSLETPLVTTPSWRFVHGCSEDKCSNSLYSLGDLDLQSAELKFNKSNSNCLLNQRIITPSDVLDECFYVDFKFDNKYYTLYNNQYVDLDEYIRVSFKADGIIINGDSCHNRYSYNSDGSRNTEKVCKTLYYEFDWQDPEWENTYTFSVIKPFLNSTITKYAFGDIKENINIEYSVENKLTNLKGGSVVRQESQLFTPEKTFIEEFFNIKKQVNYYSTRGNSDILGDLAIRIQPFVIVLNTIHDVNTEIRIYDTELNSKARVLPNVVMPPNYNLSRNDTLPVEEDETIEESGQNVGIILAILAVLIIIGGFAYIWQKSNK